MEKGTNHLRVLRAERRIAQEVLAHRTGIKPSRYWRIENGLKDPTAEEKRLLAAVLGVSVSKLGFTSAVEAMSA